MILTVIGRSGRERSAVAAHLGAHLNAVVVDGALELSWERGVATRGPDVHDVLAGRDRPIEAVCEDGPVSILPCGHPLENAVQTELVGVLEAVERKYRTVLIDCPTTAYSGVMGACQGSVLVRPSPSVVMADPIRAHRFSRTVEERIVAIALFTSETTGIERIERTGSVPVTPIPGVPPVTVPMAVGDPVDRSVQRAFRQLAATVHASMRS